MASARSLLSIARSLTAERARGADTSTRRHIKGLTLRAGDLIRIEGIPGGNEHASLDYIEIIPAPEQRPEPD